MPTGLDYPAVEAAARMEGHRLTPRIFEQIRILERAALSVLHERWGRP